MVGVEETGAAAGQQGGAALKWVRKCRSETIGKYAQIHKLQNLF